MQKLQGLYAIADADCIGTDKIISKTKEVLAAGVKVIQYRDKVNTRDHRYKNAAALRRLTNNYKCLLLINDDVQLAKSIDADGVHLGKNDASIKQARKQLGKNKIIGASCYAKFENARTAINASADYIAFGSFYPSATKPDAPRAKIELLTQAKQEFNIPICAIGGITPKNATNLLTAGADMIAVISAVFNASSPKQAVQEYLLLM
ncbi:MAG: thiamine phosphate synthase [Gammaproteobacteria bacterium]|nr:thiamine phosphate synthase [Gammaproteobacteria bacterium]MBT8123442.1 thiamine phosphate synthase [Gammaproteobacteria bacterium]NNC68988.1 thiamine phosphate synthase [Gammaproteobacteria bacterium]